MKGIRATRLADYSLLLVAMIWGSGFVATEYALRAGMPATLIMTIRFWIAALIMLPLQWRKLRRASPKALLRGVGAGGLLCAAFFAQTYGQAGTSVSNSAFLTATNVVMVPFIIWAATRKRPPLKIYLLAVLTLAGIGILTLKPGVGITLGTGDMMVLLCALLFALHIAYLGTATMGQDPGLMTFLQMAVSALLSTAALLFFDQGAMKAVPWSQGLPPLLFLAVFSTCLCFFIQTWAQQITSAAKAAILLATEGLFGSAFSVILGLENLTWNMALGGVVIIACVVFTEVDFSRLFLPKRRS